MKALLLSLLVMVSSISFAMERPNVDEFIAERDSFSCPSNDRAKTSYDNLIREQFEAQSKLYQNTVLLKGLEGLIEDQETLAQIQTALVVGPALGVLVSASSVASMGYLTTADILTGAITVAEINIYMTQAFAVIAAITTTTTYAVSDNVADKAIKLLNEETSNEGILLSIQPLADINLAIQKIENERPDLVVDQNNTAEALIDKYVGWVAYSRYKEIAERSLIMNKLLTAKNISIEQLKNNLRIVCNN